MIPCRKISWFVPVLAALAIGCGKPQPPEYYGFQDARMSKDAGGKTVVSATLKMYNPNHFSLTLRGGELDVFINDRLSGHSTLDTSIFIRKRDTFYVPVSLQVDMQQIMSNALATLFNKQIKIILDGRVRLRRDGIPFSVPFHYAASQQDLNDLMPFGANGLNGSN